MNYQAAIRFSNGEKMTADVEGAGDLNDARALLQKQEGVSAILILVPNTNETVSEPNDDSEHHTNSVA